MGVNKVEFGGETLVDLTGDTVNEQSLLNGYTAHNRAGELIEGLAVIPTKVSELENDAGYLSSTVKNLTATEEGHALDATMGKELKDEIDQLNDNLKNLKFNTSSGGVKWAKLPSGIILGYGNKNVTSGTELHTGSFPGYYGFVSININDIPFKIFKRAFGAMSGVTNWPSFLKSDCMVVGNTLVLSTVTDNPSATWNFDYFIVGV